MWVTEPLRGQCYTLPNLLEPSWESTCGLQPSALEVTFVLLKAHCPALSPGWTVLWEHPDQTASWWEFWVSLCGKCCSCCSKRVCILEVMLVVFSLFPSSCLSFADVNAGERVQTNSVATASASNSTWTGTKQPAAQEKSPVIWVLLSNTGHIWKEN